MVTIAITSFFGRGVTYDMPYCLKIPTNFYKFQHNMSHINILNTQGFKLHNHSAVCTIKIMITIIISTSI